MGLDRWISLASESLDETVKAVVFLVCCYVVNSCRYVLVRSVTFDSVIF